MFELLRVRDDLLVDELPTVERISLWISVSPAVCAKRVNGLLLSGTVASELPGSMSHRAFPPGVCLPTVAAHT